MNLFWYCSQRSKGTPNSTREVWSQDKGQVQPVVGIHLLLFSREQVKLYRWHSSSRSQCLSSILASYSLPVVMDKWFNCYRAQFSTKSDDMTNTKFISMVMVKSIHSCIAWNVTATCRAIDPSLVVCCYYNFCLITHCLRFLCYIFSTQNVNVPNDFPINTCWNNNHIIIVIIY